MQSYDLSPQGPNWQALDKFIKTEEKRHSIPQSEIPPLRVLLKIVGEGTNKHLEAIDENSLGIIDRTLLRIKILLTPSDYKLVNIKKFIDEIPLTAPGPFTKARSIIQRKIEAPKEPFFDRILRVFRELIRTPEKKQPINDSKIDEPVVSKKVSKAKAKRPKARPKKSKALPQVASQAASAKTKQRASVQPSALSSKAVNVTVPQAVIGCGMRNSGMSCYLNATVEALRFTPSFRELLASQMSAQQKGPKSELSDLLSLPTKSKVRVWNTMVAALGRDPIAEGKMFAKETLLSERQEYVEQALGGLSLRQDVINSLKSLLEGFNEDRKKVLRPLLMQSLTSLYDTLEGRHAKAKVGDADEIQAIRQMVRVGGFEARGATTQEDAQEFLIFALDILNVPSFFTKTEILYELDFPVPLELQKEDRTVLILEVSEAPEGTSIQQLLTDNVIEEEIEKASIKRVIKESDEFKVSEKEMAKIDALPPDAKQIPTLQTIKLKKDNIPQFLPLSLQRYEWQADGSYEKIDKLLPVSRRLFVPLTDDQAHVAEFKLTSVVVHDGASPYGGHYRCYALMNIAGKDEWVEYNDNVVTHRSDQESVELDIAQSGYLFFYKHVG